MRQQFRFANQGQSRSGRLLADPSPACERGLCRFGGRGGRDEPHCPIGLKSESHDQLFCLCPAK
jgi:hypothetical protein